MATQYVRSTTGVLHTTACRHVRLSAAEVAEEFEEIPDPPGRVCDDCLGT